MRITSLSLTNFRSFRATQTIDFAPVTLLFGPNSVGKSSVLMALFYVQQILEKGHCDPVRLDALGEKYVGGFKNLVNGRDLKKKIVIKISADKKGEIGSTYNNLPELVDRDFGYTVDSPTADADRVAVEFHIGWSKSEDKAYVACYKIWLDDHLIAELNSDPGMKQPTITYINYQHKALSEEYLTPENGEGYVSQFHEEVNSPRIPVGSPSFKISSPEGDELVHVPIGFQGFAGALPRIGKLFETSLDLDDPLATARVHEILSDIVVAPLDNLLELLSQSLCIGPLRIVPDALHQINPYPQQKDWYSGTAAWDTIGRSSTQTSEVNHWLNNAHTLDLGYSIRNKVSQIQTIYSGNDDTISDLLAALESFDGIEMTFSKEDLAENPDAEQVPVDVSKLKSKLQEITADRGETTQKSIKDAKNEFVLWDDVNNIEVTSSDIGVGFSQLFPLIVASVDRQQGIIACEQPELHVHPRVQVGIGDLLTQNTRKTTFLIETHSEHLILRILRRIRQTSENELPEWLDPVGSEDVSIVYMEPGQAGVKTSRIQIDQDGEFQQRWPHGFFRERGEELF